MPIAWLAAELLGKKSIASITNCLLSRNGEMFRYWLSTGNGRLHASIDIRHMKLKSLNHNRYRLAIGYILYRRVKTVDNID